MNRTGFRLALLAAVLLAFARPAHASEDRRVAVINATGRTMTAFYATASGTTFWGDNRLAAPVQPQHAAEVNLNDQTDRCLFDFKAEFDDGAVMIRHEVNACAISTYRYSQ